MVGLGGTQVHQEDLSGNSTGIAISARHGSRGTNVAVDRSRDDWVEDLRWTMTRER